jgi:hypothetical protein
MKPYNPVISNILLGIISATEKKLDGRDIAKSLESDVIDKTFGETVSEKIQRGPITNFLFELLEGFWSEDTGPLIVKVESWLKEMKKAYGDPML